MPSNVFQIEEEDSEYLGIHSAFVEVVEGMYYVNVFEEAGLQLSPDSDM